MKQPAEKKPFYLNRNWLIGFVVTMIVVIAYFFLITRPRQIANAVPTPQATSVQPGSGAGTDQPVASWKTGVTFTAPGSQPSDLLRMGDEVWVFVDEGKRLLQLSLTGENLGEITLEVLCSKAAWDGEALWCVNTSTEVSKVDPATGKVLENFDTGIENIQSIAWDGSSLWLLGLNGGLARYDRSGEQKELKGVGDLGFARDMVWVEAELWVIYIPPQLVRYDASFKSVKKESSICGLTKGVLDYAIDWDGKSLWFVDFISAQVLQCIPAD